MRGCIPSYSDSNTAHARRGNAKIVMRRLGLISFLAASLFGCVTATAPPGAGPPIERISPEELARIMPAPRPSLSLADIVRMSEEGASAGNVIAKIRETGSRFELSPSQAVDLHAQGVAKEVLDAIQSAHEQAVRDRIADEINQRESRHAEQIRREQEMRLNSYYYYDPWLRGYPGYGWGYGYLFRPYGSFYWRR